MNIDMSKAKLSALLVIIGLLIVVGLVLIVVSLRLLLSTASTAVPPIQPGSGFPVDTPDFAAFATAFCCDDGTPSVMTPSSEQIALWTEVAQTYEVRSVTVKRTHPGLYSPPAVIMTADDCHCSAVWLPGEAMKPGMVLGVTHGRARGPQCHGIGRAVLQVVGGQLQHLLAGLGSLSPGVSGCRHR